jgi:hypothetical protein
MKGAACQPAVQQPIERQARFQAGSQPGSQCDPRGVQLGRALI